MINEKEVYANQWNESSNYFYNNKSYFWMSNEIKKYMKVLEIGCGTGQSTLALIEEGHKVIAIEKNEFCLKQAKQLIKSKGYAVGEKGKGLSECDVIFLNIDIMNSYYYEQIETLSFDIVICWNVGSYWNKEMFEYYLPYMLQYGLTVEQIKTNPESSYGELIIWKSCSIAKSNNVPIHIIDRTMQPITKENDDYFVSIKRELKFSDIKYNSIKVKTISSNGKVLSVNGKQCYSDYIEIYLISILIY